jgi:hypothetical protein
LPSRATRWLWGAQASPPYSSASNGCSLSRVGRSGRGDRGSEPRPRGLPLPVADHARPPAASESALEPLNRPSRTAFHPGVMRFGLSSDTAPPRLYELIVSRFDGATVMA